MASDESALPESQELELANRINRVDGRLLYLIDPKNRRQRDPNKIATGLTSIKNEYQSYLPDLEASMKKWVESAAEHRRESIKVMFKRLLDATKQNIETLDKYSSIIAEMSKLTPGQDIKDLNERLLKLKLNHEAHNFCYRGTSALKRTESGKSSRVKSRVGLPTGFAKGEEWLKRRLNKLSRLQGPDSSEGMRFETWVDWIMEIPSLVNAHETRHAPLVTTTLQPWADKLLELYIACAGEETDQETKKSKVIERITPFLNETRPGRAGRAAARQKKVNSDGSATSPVAPGSSQPKNSKTTVTVRQTKQNKGTIAPKDEAKQSSESMHRTRSQPTQYRAILPRPATPSAGQRSQIPPSSEIGGLQQGIRSGMSRELLTEGKDPKLDENQWHESLWKASDKTLKVSRVRKSKSMDIYHRLDVSLTLHAWSGCRDRRAC